MKLRLLVFLLSCSSLFSFAGSSKGTEFWIGFMENLAQPNNGPPVFQVQLNSDVNTTCTLSIPGLSYSIALGVAANQVLVFTVPWTNLFPLGDEAITNNGIRIVSRDSIEVKAIHWRLYFSESTAVLPLSDLGTEYAVITHTDFVQASPAEFIVLATQNNTTVEIIPSKPTLSGKAAGLPFTKVLQRGQVYQIQAMGDLTGTQVRSINSKRKIAVFAGARQSAVLCGADDHLYDQVYPVNFLGTKYHIVPFSGHLSDLIKILATQNNTTINLNGSTTYSLSAGQNLSLLVNGPFEINANAPIAVAQLATGQACNGTVQPVYGDGGLINVVPADMGLSKSVFYAADCWSNGAVTMECFLIRRLNVVVKSSALGSVYFDNVLLPAASFSTVGASFNYSYIRLKLDTMAALQHTLACDSGFNAMVYAFGSYSFYGHNLGYKNTIENEFDDTGLETWTKESEITLFPNPAEHTLTIASQVGIRSVSLVDLWGRPLLQSHCTSCNTIELQVSELPPGVYSCIVKLAADNTPTIIKKFTK